MRKFSILLGAAALLFIGTTAAQSEKITRGIKSDKVQLTFLIDGLTGINDGGVYRIDDYESGYHVYLISTSRGDGQPQIHAVPILEQQ